MDLIVKAKLNKFFIKNYSKVYNTTPNLKAEGNEYYYTTNNGSNIICLLPLTKL